MIDFNNGEIKMTKHISEYTVDELSEKIKAIKAEREKTANALKRYEEELERREQEVSLGVPLENLMYGRCWGKYSFCFASDESKRVFEERFNEYLKVLQKLAKGEPIDIQFLLPLLKKGWVAMDKSGNWYWYSEKPKQDLDEWIRSSGFVERLSPFNMKSAEDWKNSLMECGL